MRLFFAIELSNTTQQAVERAIDAIGIARPPWRWVATDNFHYTMKFLGEMPDAKLPLLMEAAEAACEGIGPIELGLGALGGFPNLKQPRVLFYEATGEIDSMKTLASRLDRSLAARVGTEPDRRPFRAHLTIARVKNPIPPEIADKLAAAEPFESRSEIIQSLSLMLSELSPKGAKYQCLKEIALL